MGEQTYVWRSAGGGSRPFVLSWNEGILNDLMILRDPDASGEARQRLGEALRATLSGAGWSAVEPELEEALRRGEAVHIAVRSSAAELYALPWELLTVGASGKAIAEISELTLSYEWPETHTTPIAPEPPAEGGRVLLAASDAGGAVPLDAQAMHIARACAEGGLSFDPEQDILTNASLASLEAAFGLAKSTDRPIRVLHLLAHGQGGPGGYGVALQGGLADAAALRGVLGAHAGMLRCVVLSVCDAGSVRSPGATLSSVGQALHRAGIAAVLASRAPLSVPGSIGMTEVFYRSLLVDLCTVSEAVRAARLSELRTGRTGDALALQLHARESDLECRPIVFRPYRGLLPFAPTGSRFFVGRSAEVAALAERVQKAGRGEAPRFQVLSGPSACGKTSLVMGGLVPLLEKADPAWEISVARMDRAHAAELGRGPRSAPMLLVVDQLEEALDGANEVLRALWRLANTPGSSVVVLLPLRIDLLGPLGALMLSPEGPRFDKVAYDPRHSLFLAQMTEAELVEVIREPARRVGIRVDDGLIAAILAEVGDTPAPLPLLAVALDALWLRRANDALDPAVWREMDGLSGALARTAEAAWIGLNPEEQQRARGLLVRMVQPGENGLPSTRKRLDLDALGRQDAATSRVLNHLIQARLVSSGDAETDPEHGRWAELAHDALLRSWPRLRDWVEEERGKLHELDRLNREFQAYQANPSPDMRLRGGRLVRALELSERYGDELPSELRQWLLDCQRRTRLQAQRGRLLAFAIAALAVLVALNMARLRGRAEDQRAAAQTSLYQRELVTARSQLATGEDREALETALRAWRMEQEGQQFEESPMILPGLLSELLESVTLRRVVQGHARAVSALVASPDGRRVASASLDGTAALWGMDGAPIARLETFGEPITALSFSADGQSVLVGGRLGRVCRWSLDHPGCAELGAYGRTVMGLAEGPDKRLYVGLIDGRVLVRGPDGTEQTLLEPADGALNSLALAPDGAIATGEDGAARLALPSGEVIQVSLPGERAMSVRFRPGRPDQLVIASQGLRVWTRGSEPLPPLLEHLGGVRAIDFVPDGRALVSLGGDDALVWHRMVKAPGRRMPSGRAGGTTLAVGAEGQLVSGTQSGELLFRSTNPSFVRSVEGHKGPLVAAVWVGPDRLVSAGEDGRLFTVADQAHRLDEGAPLTAMVRESEGAVVTARSDGRIQRWSLSTGLASELCQTSATPTALTRTPGGVAWAGQFGAVGVCADGAARELVAPSAGRDATAIAQLGADLLVAFDDGSLERIDASGASTRLVEGGAAQGALAVLPDGGYISGGSDGALSGSDGTTLRLNGGAILDLDLRADGLLAVASADGAVRLVWRGELVSTRRLHDGPVRTVAFSDDGAQLATGGEDRLLRLSPVGLDDAQPWVLRACDWLGGGCEEAAGPNSPAGGSGI